MLSFKLSRCTAGSCCNASATWSSCSAADTAKSMNNHFRPPNSHALQPCPPSHSWRIPYPSPSATFKTCSSNSTVCILRPVRVRPWALPRRYSGFDDDEEASSLVPVRPKRFGSRQVVVTNASGSGCRGRSPVMGSRRGLVSLSIPPFPGAKSQSCGDYSGLGFSRPARFDDTKCAPKWLLLNELTLSYRARQTGRLVPARESKWSFHNRLCRLGQFDDNLDAIEH